MMILNRKDYTKLIEYCKNELPNEACAILAGKDDHITQTYLMENTQKQPDNFLMKPEEQFKVVKDMREKGLEMLGIFHSHPDSPARPSLRDISMAFYPEVVYFILSLENKEEPVLKGFRIVNRKVRDEEIKIEEK